MSASNTPSSVSPSLPCPFVRRRRKHAERHNNWEIGITGALCHLQGNDVQCLEGDETAIRCVRANIAEALVMHVMRTRLCRSAGSSRRARSRSGGWRAWCWTSKFENSPALWRTWA
ncbi:BLUF domain-containing protein [Variovorax atrisoli]|uniref:BLUF domain-containing protein n=1 Tax=Variovorax atrisoli TaxID=3394203 RepID=UPI0013DEE123